MMKRIRVPGYMAALVLAVAACSEAERHHQNADTQETEETPGIETKAKATETTTSSTADTASVLVEPDWPEETLESNHLSSVDAQRRLLAADIMSLSQAPAAIGDQHDPDGAYFLPSPGHDQERYRDVDAHPVKLVSEEPVSTFSIDVDTASYANVRRFLKNGRLPPTDAVRVEELVNYFSYNYPVPSEEEGPFSVNIALFQSPWDEGRQLLRLGLKGYELASDMRPRANLVFLVDTSGSMQHPDKLPLLKRSLRLLINQLDGDDSIAIVTYAGSAGVALEPTSGQEKAKILAAIDQFAAGGSTAGAAGLTQAYQLAAAHFDDEGVNRVILATDGDFNVGPSDPNALEDLIRDKRESGIYLSVLGFGQGNLNDHLMQTIAQAGNGNASYIDSLIEAQKVLVDEMGSTFFPIADDVKIQIEFNPAFVATYRLIGYETRLLARQDFHNDKVDAGEIGSGHTVTAFYEITAPNSPSLLVDDLRYGVQKASKSNHKNKELAWLKLRYKQPGQDRSQVMEKLIMTSSATSFDQAAGEARFAAAVVGFGQILRKDVHLQSFDLEAVHQIATDARGDDPAGLRAEFLQLIKLARHLKAE